MVGHIVHNQNEKLLFTKSWDHGQLCFLKIETNFEFFEMVMIISY